MKNNKFTDGKTGDKGGEMKKNRQKETRRRKGRPVRFWGI